VKSLTSLDLISRNIARKDLKFVSEVHRDLGSNGFLLQLLKRRRKNSYSENVTMTCLENRNPRIQSSDTKCYVTSSQNRRKDRSMTSKSASLSEETSFTLHKMNNSSKIQMKKPPFYIYESNGSQYNQSRHNNYNIRAQQ